MTVEDPLANANQVDALTQDFGALTVDPLAATSSAQAPTANPRHIAAPNAAPIPATTSAHAATGALGSRHQHQAAKKTTSAHTATPTTSAVTATLAYIKVPLPSSASAAPSTSSGGFSRPSLAQIEGDFIKPNHYSDPFAKGPFFDPNLHGERMQCSSDSWNKEAREYRGCLNKSEPNFRFSAYHCTLHGKNIDAQWRFRCVHNKNLDPNEPSDQCGLYDYRLLHEDNQLGDRTFRVLNPVADERTYRCAFHRQNSTGMLFRSQLRPVAGDIEVTVNGEPKSLVSRQTLQDMATRYSYSEQTMEWVERAIQSAADALSYNSLDDLKAEVVKVAGYDVKNEKDFKYLDDLYYKYRDLLSTGYVYFILYKNGQFNNRPVLSIKIGYTSKPVHKRIEQYDCDIHEEPLVILPRSGTDDEQTQPQPLAFAYLLERILHAIFARKQYDYRCPEDRAVHGEIFYFDPVVGIKNELKGARSRIADLSEQLDAWVEIVRGMEETHACIRPNYTPLMNRLKALKMQASRRTRSSR